MKLNKEQKLAIRNKDKNHLVIASAGSGKTRVLTSRVIHLLNNNESDILLLTFTVKAAEEMVERVKANVTRNALRRVTSGTFHSFAHKVLRKYSQLIGYDNNFTITDAKDASDLLSLIARGQNCRLGARTLLDIHSSSINIGKSIKQTCKDKLVNVDKKEIKLITKTLDKYSEYKKKFSIMDFDDLLVNMNKLLQLNNKIALNDIRCYKHILVDEFQDTNQIQIDIVKGLLAKETQLFAVGDKNQNIYAFRGANPQHIIDFPKTFNSSYTILQQNYRSTQQILDLANEVAKGFKDDFNMNMFSTLSGDKPRYIRPNNEEEQAYKIVTEIKHLVSTGTNTKDIAILYRSNSTADLFETNLRSNNIPYTRKGGQSLFDMKHIKDIICLLRIITFKMDTISWSRALQSLPGVGVATSSEALSFVAKQGVKGLKEYKSTRHWDNISILYNTIRSMIKNKKNVSLVLDMAIDFWKVERIKHSDKTEEYKESIKSLKKIFKGYTSIKKALIDLTLSPKEDEDKKNGVTLSTGHSAKGLEWKYVYIVNVTEGSLPSYYFITDKKDKEIEDKIKVQEELRLFYVMITRAQKELTISSPLSDEEAQHWKQFGKLPKRRNIPSESRFLSSIENLDSLVTKRMPLTLANVSESKSLLSHIRETRNKGIDTK